MQAMQVCTHAEVLRGMFPTFSLPTDGTRTSLLLLLSSIDCSGSQTGVLLGFGGSEGAGEVDVSVDCATQRLLLASAGQGTVSYQLPAGSAAAGTPLALLLSQDSAGAGFAACANGRPLAPRSGSSPALLQRLGSSPALLGPAVVFGARTDTARSVRADVAAAYLSDGAIPCERTAPGQPIEALQQELAAAAAQAARAAPPVVAVRQDPSGDAVVGQLLTLTVTAMPSGDAQGDAHR